MAQTFLFKREMFVWVDETGTDKRDQLRKYGYALRGTTPVYHRFLSRRDRVWNCVGIPSTNLKRSVHRNQSLDQAQSRLARARGGKLAPSVPLCVSRPGTEFSNEIEIHCTHTLPQCCPASVGLAQARPNKILHKTTLSKLLLKGSQ